MGPDAANVDQKVAGQKILAELRNHFRIIVCLGLYWAWASSVFFGTACVSYSGNPLLSSEIVHLVALVACSVITILIPIIDRHAQRILSFISVSKALILATAGTALIPVCSLFSNEALIFVSILAGLGEAFALYQLCKSINPDLGDQIVLSIFSLALIISSFIYIFIYIIPKYLSIICTILLPISIFFLCGESNEEQSSSTSRNTSPRSSIDDRHSKSTLPWKVMTGFSVFGIAFGLMRGLSPSGEQFFNYYYLIHELCRMLIGLASFLVAVKCSNRFWTVSMLGSSFFAISFLLAYGSSSNWLNMLLNATASAGYTCFELLMWMIIYELASETRLPLERPYGVGRGLMQIGTAIGTITALFINNNNFYMSLSQITIVSMLIIILTFFNDHNVAILWGIRKESLDMRLSDETRVENALTQAYGLTPRECEVALLLMKGRSEPFIAESMGLSRSTIHSHVVRLYLKAEVHSRQELLSKIEEISA